MGRRECSNWDGMGQDGMSEGNITVRRLQRNLEAREGRWRMGQAKSRLPAFQPYRPHPQEELTALAQGGEHAWYQHLEQGTTPGVLARRRCFQKLSAITSAGSEQESFT